MIMEEEKLESLFADYGKELSSGMDDKVFMSRLNSRLQTIETLKAETAGMRRRNRRAIAIAAVAGFICGFVAALLVPSIEEMIVRTFAFGLMSARQAVDYAGIIAWLMACVAVGGMTYLVYDIAYAFCRRRLVASTSNLQNLS